MNKHQLPDHKQRIRHIKANCTTNPHYGKSPDTLSIPELLNSGFLLLDKPSGPSSHQVVAWIRDLLTINKAGQSGTLDPRVTGVLPVSLGSSTKGISAIARSDKEYVCLMKLHKPATEERIKKVCSQLVGDIDQMPPLRSAVKRQTRQRTIYYLNVLEIQDNQVLFVCGCEAGTYIRTLCVQIGKLLKTGAHMEELRRTQVGRFHESDCSSLTDLKDALEFYKKDGEEEYLRSIIKGPHHLYKGIGQIVVRDSSVDSLCHGAPLGLPGVVQVDSDIKRNDLIVLMSLKEEPVALATSQMSTEEILEKTTGICATPSRIIMNRGTYPKLWKH